MFCIAIISLFFFEEIFSYLYPGLKNLFLKEKVFLLLATSIIFNLINFIVVYYSSIMQAKKLFLFDSFVLIIPNFILILYIGLTFFFTNNFFFDYINYYIILSGICQVLFIVFFFKKNFELFFFDFKNIKEKIYNTNSFFVVYTPTLFIVLLIKLHSIVEKYFLSFKFELIPLYYISQKISFVPMAIFVSACTTVLLPEFVKKNDNQNKGIELLSIIVKYNILICLYVSIIFFTYNDFIINALFSNGNYSQLQLLKLTNIFSIYSLSIIFFTLFSIFYSFLISQSEIKYITNSILFAFIITFIYMYLIYKFDRYEYFAISVLIFYAVKSSYLFYKINEIFQKKLIFEIYKNKFFFFSLLLIFVINKSYLIYVNDSISTNLITIFMLVLHFLICCKYNFLKIDELNILLKKFKYKFKKAIN